MLQIHTLIKVEDIIGLQREITNSNTGETKTVSFREKTANNIIKGIADSKNIAFSRVLYGLGIRFVGSTIAKKLVAHYENIEPLMKADYEELIQIPEIGEQIAKSLIQYFSTPVHAETINRLKANGLNFEEIKKQVALDSEILLSKKIIVSGVFSAFTRSELKVLIEKNGGINSSSLSSKTDYLIAGEKMGPSKRAKAEKHKITIIDEQAFIKMIGYGA